MTVGSSRPTDRVELVHDTLRRRIAGGDLPDVTGSAALPRPLLTDLWHAQAASRLLDRMARRLQAQGEAFYTIGSSGHEGTAAVAAAVRPTDMAFLHYRDAAFQIMRAGQVPGTDVLRDMVASIVSSVDDPVSGGRHKVLGSKELLIPPQTSTIASHLPKAVGAAHSIGLARRHRPVGAVLADDGIVVCSFGDASLNHSTAQGAINTAGWITHQQLPLPLLFVCEDNGLGISVRTPTGWVEATMASRPGVEYVHCDGLDVADAYSVACEAAERVRRRRRPVFLHFTCVRLFGHAGADAPSTYLTTDEIEADEARDPLLVTAAHLVAAGAGSSEVLATYDGVEREIDRHADELVTRPRLRHADEVMATIVPPARAVEAAPTHAPSPDEAPQPMARLINRTLHEVMEDHDEVVMAGEDIGAKGGVYGVTRGLQDRFGRARVIDSLLDEQAILGLAIGMAHNGFVPIVEIQFLAYLHNAEDQLRGEAATLSFFSQGRFTNPMVVRVPGLGYQRGFGGHFHNDNSLAVLRDVPGLVVACPSDGREAAMLLRECVRLARGEQRVVVFVEPIARYFTRDLHDDGDGGWLRTPPAGGDVAPLASVRVLGDGTDVAIVTYGNGVYLAEQARRALADAHDVAARTVDLRWVAPLATDALLEATAACGRVLIVDECRSTGSQSEALMALFAERSTVEATRIAAHDSFIATGPAYAATLPSRDDIVTAALSAIS